MIAAGPSAAPLLQRVRRKEETRHYQGSRQEPAGGHLSVWAAVDLQHLLHAGEHATSAHQNLINDFRHGERRSQQTANCVHRRSLSLWARWFLCSVSGSYWIFPRCRGLFGYVNIWWNLLNQHYWFCILREMRSERVLRPQLSWKQQFCTRLINGQCVTRRWPRL